VNLFTISLSTPFCETQLKAIPFNEVRSGRGHESFLQEILGARNLVHYLARLFPLFVNANLAGPLFLSCVPFFERPSEQQAVEMYRPLAFLACSLPVR
jgi:hypothetical protein